MKNRVIKKLQINVYLLNKKTFKCILLTREILKTEFKTIENEPKIPIQKTTLITLSTVDSYGLCRLRG